MAIDSCRRTSNPDKEKLKGMKCAKVSLLQLISEVPIFFLSLVFAKTTCRLQAFHLKFNETGLWNRNVSKRTNFIFHQLWTCQILLNEDLCYFQNSGIDQCCVMFLSFCFVLLFSVTIFLCVLSCDLMFSCKTLTQFALYLAHSFKKMWIMSQEGQGSRYRPHHFLGLMLV